MADEGRDPQKAGEETNRYQCRKIVRAAKISVVIASEGQIGLVGRDTLLKVSADFIKRYRPEVGGYYIIYKDEYESFSPAAEFEDEHVRI